MYSLLPSELQGALLNDPLGCPQARSRGAALRLLLRSGFLNLLQRCWILKWLVTGDTAALVKPHPPDYEKSGLHYGTPSNPRAFLACGAASPGAPVCNAEARKCRTWV